MSRRWHCFVSLVMLAVLTGAPAMTVICAEWCAPSNHRGSAKVAVAGPQERMPDMDCHGGAATGMRLDAHTAPECLDATLSWRDTGPVTPRLDLARQAAADTITTLPVLGRLSTGQALPPHLAHASPPRPVFASLVLRI